MTKCGGPLGASWVGGHVMGLGNWFWGMAGGALNPRAGLLAPLTADSLLEDRRGAHLAAVIACSRSHPGGGNLQSPLMGLEIARAPCGIGFLQLCAVAPCGIGTGVRDRSPGLGNRTLDSR